MIKQILLWIGFLAYSYFGIKIIKHLDIPLDEKIFLVASVIASAFFMYMG